MVDFALTRIWLFRLLFAAICGTIIFFQLLPLKTAPGGWPAPDLLQAFTCAWVLRRPDYVPIVLIAAIMLLADMLFLRPPGLQAALMVAAAEFLRQRIHMTRDLPFGVEWALVATVLTGVALGQRLILLLLLVERPPLSLFLMQLLATILAYPLVVFVSRHIFGIRPAARGKVDTLGHRP